MQIKIFILFIIIFIDYCNIMYILYIRKNLIKFNFLLYIKFIVFIGIRVFSQY